MPILEFQTPEIDVHIVDRLANQLTRAILKDIEVLDFFDNKNLAITTGRRAISKTSDINGNLMLLDDRCDVVVHTSLNPSNQAWTPNPMLLGTMGRSSAFWRDDMLPIFEDKEADIVINEILTPMTMTFEFELNLRTKEAARRAEIAIISKFKTEAPFIEHAVQFDYPLSRSFMTALYIFYRARKSLHHMTWYQYCQRFMLNNIGILKSVDNDSEIVLQHTRIGVLGQLEYDSERIEAVMIEQYPRRWKVIFTYKIQIAAPIGQRIFFPVYIENQLVNGVLIGEHNSPYEFTPLKGWYPDTCIHAYTKGHVVDEVVPPLRLPYYNGFIPPKCIITERKFSPILIGALQINEVSKTTQSMYDISGYRFHPVVLELMQLHGTDIFKTNGIFNITVFQNEKPIPVEALSMDDKLELVMDLRYVKKRYHLVISEATSLEFMDSKYIKLLIKYGSFFPGTIGRHIKYLIDHGFYVLDPYNRVLQIISMCMRTGRLDLFIRAMISTGHCTNDIFFYTATPWQFYLYLLEHRSLLDGRYLYSVLRDMGIADGCIKDYDIPDIDGHIHDGRPITSGGGYYGVNVPLRIIDYTVTANRADNS